jgi:hypothetical protein
MDIAHNNNDVKYIKVGYEIKYPWHVGDSSESLSTACVMKTLQKCLKLINMTGCISNMQRTAGSCHLVCRFIKSSRIIVDKEF